MNRKLTAQISCGSLSAHAVKKAKFPNPCDMRPSDDTSPGKSLDRADLAPAWASPELVERTRELWERLYGSELTEDEVSTILGGVGRLFELLSRG